MMKDKSTTILDFAKGGIPPRYNKGVYRQGNKFVMICPTGVWIRTTRLDFLKTLHEIAEDPQVIDWDNLPILEEDDN